MPQPSGNPLADFLNGIGGGFQSGYGFRENVKARKRATAQEEYERARQERQDAQAADEYTQRTGREWVEPGTEQRTPEMAPPQFDVDQLRTGVGQALLNPPRQPVGLRNAFLAGQPKLEVPAGLSQTPPMFQTSVHPGGYAQVQPSETERTAERAAQLRRGVGAQLAGVIGGGITPEQATAAQDAGILDELWKRQHPEAPAPISAFQQASIDIDRERLGLERGRLDLARQEADTKRNKPAMASFSDTTGLQKQFTAEPVVRNASELAQAYGKITGALSAGTPAGDMAGIFAFMKILDPGSTVREGEYASARNTTGIPGQILNLYNRARDGQILTPDQRADFMAQAEGVARAQQELVAPIIQRYRVTAGQYGIDPTNIIYDPLAEVLAPAPAASDTHGATRSLLKDVSDYIDQQSGAAPARPPIDPRTADYIRQLQKGPLPPATPGSGFRLR